MIEINYDTALSALNNAIMVEGSDFVYAKEVLTITTYGDQYPTCSYLHMGKDGELTVPGCIVGRVLIDLGVPVEKIQPYNTGHVAGGILRELAKDNILSFTSKAASLLAYAQYVQDAGVEWGEAVHDAVEHVASFRWSEDEQSTLGIAPHVTNPDDLSTFTDAEAASF